MRTRRREAVLAVIAIMSIAAFYAYRAGTWGDIRGAWNRKFGRPTVLENVSPNRLDAASAEKNTQGLFQLWRSGVGSGAIVADGWTIEGDPVEVFVIVANGRGTVVFDGTRDRHDGSRSFHVFRVVKLELVESVGRNVTDITKRRDGDRLRCEVEDGAVYAF